MAVKLDDIEKEIYAGFFFEAIEKRHEMEDPYMNWMFVALDMKKEGIADTFEECIYLAQLVGRTYRVKLEKMGYIIKENGSFSLSRKNMESR